MSNDITALMATMKAAAEKASNGEWVKESGDGWEATCSTNDQANGGFIIAHFEGPDAAANREFVQAANPANVRALVEALEAEQQKSAKQGRHACELFDEVKQLQEQLRTVELSNSVLESHTVTMPKLYGMDFCDRIVPDSRNGFLFYSEQVVDALAAAGIQVIEGEGQ